MSPPPFKTVVFWAPLLCRILKKKLRFDASLVSRITAFLDSQRDQYRRWYWSLSKLPSRRGVPTSRSQLPRTAAEKNDFFLGFQTPATWGDIIKTPKTLPIKDPKPQYMLYLKTIREYPISIPPKKGWEIVQPFGQVHITYIYHNWVVVSNIFYFHPLFGEMIEFD